MSETNEQRMKRLRAKAMALPQEPGVYIMRNSTGDIIYIGKAKVLKNRVSSYFGSQNNHAPKVLRMVSNVENFDYIITDSEFEALVLECSLIKQNTPRYNILLKDDKGYSYIRISGDKWKKITEAKKTADDGAEYIGPYMSSYYVKNAIDQAHKIFKLPTCNRTFPQDIGKGRPCLNYHIKQCMAPCKGNVSYKLYNDTIQEAIAFLRGGNSLNIKDLTKQMTDAAENLEFEQAARIRDRIAAVKKMAEKQKVVQTNIKEQDIIALAGDSDKACFEVFRYMGGTLTDREYFILNDIGENESAIGEFIMGYYSMRDRIPPRITVSHHPEDEEALLQWLCSKAGKKVELTVPQIGHQLRLLQMCIDNGAEHIAQAHGMTGKQASALEELGQLLGLNKAPCYIESYDISNQNGTENVAGMVVFENGKPLKRAYKKFKIKTVVGQDDFASMNEVLQRRFAEYEQLKDTQSGFGRLPDLILLDGGKGQVSAVEAALKKYHINVPVFGMVKDDKHRTRAITGGGEEIAINSKRRVFTLVSNIQDEVHRFAIGYHRQRRKNSTINSTLTNIDGVGKTRAAALLKYFGTITNIKQADIEELALAPTMTKPCAVSIYNYFHKEQSQEQRTK